MDFSNFHGYTTGALYLERGKLQRKHCYTCEKEQLVSVLSPEKMFDKVSWKINFNPVEKFQSKRFPP